MKKSVLKPIKIPSAKSEDQLATRKMLYLVRDELRSQIQSLDLKVDAKISGLDSKIENLTAIVHRSVLLAEEQRADNRIVLEGTIGQI